MSIKVGEVGRDLYIATDFDLSGNTDLKIKFTSPDEATVVEVTNPAVTAPAVPSPDLPLIGILAANTYMKYTTDGTEFTAGGDGTWTVCVTYEDATPKKFFGDDGPLLIGEAC